MNYAELKETVDEALLRMDPGWSYEELRSGTLKLSHPAEPFQVRIDMADRYMHIAGHLNDATLRSYCGLNRPEYKLPYTNSSAKIANAIQLAILPRMCEIYELALAARNNATAPDTVTQSFLDISSRLSKPYYWREQVLSFKGDQRYRSPEVRTEVTFDMDGAAKGVVNISGNVPIDVARELLRQLEAREGEHPAPEAVAAEAVAA